MANTAIKVENLSKAYQLGEIGTGTISRDLERWFAKILGKEDPFLKIGETNNRSIPGVSDVVWSLKDLNFEIEQGQAVGIIGRNGAGKSTLLKILSKITSPTTGRITGRGRIASLLEVGTGFHPELTGRENVFLNGAILGMRKNEIKRKFDEIVEFAGVSRYIDTPVKRYSSGMYIRLAFAVAAHLESEILIVDEVLAVGDAEFQKKCLGKMDEVSKGEGKTVMFVSHNMEAVKKLCKKGIYLNNGQLAFYGKIADAIGEYQKAPNNLEVLNWVNQYPVSEHANILSAEVEGEVNTLSTAKPVVINFKTEINKSGLNILIDVCLYNRDGYLVFDVVSPPRDFDKGIHQFSLSIPPNFLNTGEYHINVVLVQNHNSILFEIEHVLNFNIEEGGREIEFFGEWPGIVRPIFNWKIE